MADIGVSCATCDVFVASPDGKAGVCRRNPPTVFLIQGQPDALGRPTTQTPSLWPATGADMWCGAHPMFGTMTSTPIDSRLATEAQGEA